MVFRSIVKSRPSSISPNRASILSASEASRAPDNRRNRPYDTLHRLFPGAERLAVGVELRVALCAAVVEDRNHPAEGADRPVDPRLPHATQTSSSR